MNSYSDLDLLLGIYIIITWFILWIVGTTHHQKLRNRVRVLEWQVKRLTPQEVECPLCKTKQGRVGRAAGICKACGNYVYWEDKK